MGGKKYVDVMRTFLKMEKGSKSFTSIANKCRVLKAEEGKVSVEFEVDERMMNNFGTLHGGCSATMVDVITTGALVTSPRGIPGVSVDLHMTYLAAVKLGDTVQLDAEVIRAGRSMAFTRALLYRKPDMALIATGLHTKAFPGQASGWRQKDDTAPLDPLAPSSPVPSADVNPLFYERMKRFEKMDKQEATFSGRVWNARLTHADQFKLSAEFVVDHHQIEPFGNTLHGGCSSTMVDFFTCAALVVATGRPAVSVNLNTTYLSPAPLGTRVRIDAEVVKHGRLLAYTKADLFRVEDGVPIASAKHTLAFNEKIVVREK